MEELAIQIIINVGVDGRLSVSGFPNNVTQAQNILHSTSDAINNYFIEAAKAGKLDDKGNVVKSNIIQPDKPIIQPIPMINPKKS